MLHNDLSSLTSNFLCSPQPAAPPVAPEENQGSGVKADPEPDAAPGLGSGSSSEECYSCGQRLYLLARVNAMGKFFHRSCFTCHKCGHPLRLGGYTFHQTTGGWSLTTRPLTHCGVPGCLYVHRVYGSTRTDWEGVL